MSSLDSRIAEGVSPAFRADVVGGDQYRRGIEQIARQQEALLAALEPGEELLVILPYYREKSIVVLSNRRLFTVNKAVEREMALSRIVETELASHPGGFLLIMAIGPNYVPYPPGGLRGPALAEYQRNFLQVEVLGMETARHFVSLLDGERSRQGS
ncbi:hypothetical protein KDL01_20250 [Actinospica durhamensis]|uniref:Uncharacterized protein n=1 Tax=Actinospica durhamensis TaxID=1508375 RepID=A0A941IT55_9ACTN|nr:hypothetical protein [Actinospica durhamensis]MBR7835618.1 hypothetical protein [Actinospica durhamensis]